MPFVHFLLRMTTPVTAIQIKASTLSFSVVQNAGGGVYTSGNARRGGDTDKPGDAYLSHDIDTSRDEYLSG